MKHISSVLLLFSFVTVAAAQEQSTGATFDGGMIGRMCMAVQKTTGAALADDGELSPLQVDSSGNLRTTSSFSWSGSTTDPSKLEDAASVAGDRGMFMLGIQNRAGANYGSADLDYTPVSLNQFGGVKCELSTDFTDNSAKNPYRLEDAAFASGNAVNVVAAVRQDTPASSTDTDGDVINLKTDSLGRLWTNPWLGTEATYTTVVALAESSISNTYGTLVTNSNGLKHLEIYNGTDTAMYISFDASTNHWFIPAGSTKVFAYQQLGLKESSNVSIKYDTNPSTGSVYASAMY